MSKNLKISIGFGNPRRVVPITVSAFSSVGRHRMMPLIEVR